MTSPQPLRAAGGPEPAGGPDRRGAPEQTGADRDPAASGRPQPPGGPGRGRPGRGRPSALDPPMVPFVLAGTAAWAVTGLILLVFFRDWLAAHDRTHWLWTCAAGAGLGLVGLTLMIRHDANRRARRRAHADDG